MSQSAANSKYANSPQYPNGHPELRAGQHRTRTCSYCDEEYADGYDDEFCSEWCKCNGIAYDALRSIRHDHTHCLSCFRRLKILIPSGRNHVESTQQSAPHTTDQLSKDIPTYPAPDHPGAIAVGGVIPREVAEPGYHWDMGEEFRANPTEGDWEFLPRDVQSTKVCECGVAHHGTADSLKNDLSKQEAIRRTERLCDILDGWDDDEWGHEYDKDALFESVKDDKAVDDMQGRDREILHSALAFAIRRAR